MNEPMSLVLDEFGQAVMTHVRDDAISFLERVLSGRMADATSKELHSQLRDLSPAEAEAIRRLLVTAVDAGIVRFLHFVDECDLQLLFQSRSGDTVNIREISDGLAGEFHTDKGWIARFSKYPDGLSSVD